MIKHLPKDKQLILFDGVCNLCNASINYVIKHDKNNHFLFGALQSDIGQEIIKKFNIDTKKTDSIILYANNNVSYKSSAALKIAGKLGFPQNLITVFFIIPPFIRNWGYDIIAKNRYKWFGKQDSCMIPTAELKARFVN